MLGLGAIGLRLAELVRVFPMRVIAVRRHPAPVDWIDWVGGAADLPRLLAESDFLFNVLPLTEETRGLIGEVQFRAMKPGAIYINYGRGATTDTAALLRALREGWIGGAGLDVVDPEPLPADHPLWTMDNVVLTPHYGGSRADSFERKSAILIENLRRHSKGEALMNVIDKTLGY